MKKLIKEDIQKRVLKGGEPLSLELFEWDEENRIFKSEENGLVFSFGDLDDINFKTGSWCIFNTRYNCTFDTGSHCTFDTCSGCFFKTSYSCTFKTGSHCTFDTSYNCIFNTNCTCTFNTQSHCIFNTDSHCTFDTGLDCTFKTSYNCIFKTDSKCVIIRRDEFEIIQPVENQRILLCPYGIKGYLFEKDNKFYYSEDKENEYIIVDNILSKVISKKGNVLKVINYNEDKESYIIKDGDLYSHGETIKEARESLVYKISSRDTSVYKDLTLDSVLTKDECIKLYRVITGACESGTRYFVSKQEPSKIKDKYSIKKLIRLTEGQYGNSELKSYFKF